MGCGTHVTACAACRQAEPMLQAACLPCGDHVVCIGRASNYIYKSHRRTWATDATCASRKRVCRGEPSGQQCEQRELVWTGLHWHAPVSWHGRSAASCPQMHRMERDGQRETAGQLHRQPGVRPPFLREAVPPEPLHKRGGRWTSPTSHHLAPPPPNFQRLNVAAAVVVRREGHVSGRRAGHANTGCESAPPATTTARQPPPTPSNCPAATCPPCY